MAKKTKNNKTMKRRNFLKGAGAAALGAATVSSFPTPAISGGHMEWIACSAFGKASGLGKAIDRFASYINNCLLYTSPSPRDLSTSRMPSSA